MTEEGGPLRTFDREGILFAILGALLTTAAIVFVWLFATGQL